MRKKGILIGCLAIGMSISVSAFTHKAISASMKVQSINYKGNMKNQEVIVYNDTTYVPVRSISELVGVPVDYKDGIIYLGDRTNDSNINTGNTETNSGNNNYIGEAKAKSIALQHAGVGENATTFTKIEMDREDNKVVYEVEFYVGNKEYDYEIDALTGAIISYDYDIEDFEIPNISQSGNYIGKEKAEQIALNHAKLSKQQVKYLKNELDEDDGTWEYQVEFRYGNKEYEYEINAYTGKIIDFSVENED